MRSDSTRSHPATQVDHAGEGTRHMATVLIEDLVDGVVDAVAHGAVLLGAPDAFSPAASAKRSSASRASSESLVGTSTTMRATNLPRLPVPRPGMP